MIKGAREHRAALLQRATLGGDSRELQLWDPNYPEDLQHCKHLSLQTLGNKRCTKEIIKYRFGDTYTALHGLFGVLFVVCQLLGAYKQYPRAKGGPA